MPYKYVEFSVLEGQTIKDVRGLQQYSDEVFIDTEEGKTYILHHVQDCCECVTLEDFDGDVEELKGGLIVTAEEVHGEDKPAPGGYVDSFTWTFYKIETNKGGLWLRWLGESNGYYSESVEFAET